LFIDFKIINVQFISPFWIHHSRFIFLRNAHFAIILFLATIFIRLLFRLLLRMDSLRPPIQHVIQKRIVIVTMIPALTLHHLFPVARAAVQNLYFLIL